MTRFVCLSLLIVGCAAITDQPGRFAGRSPEGAWFGLAADGATYYRLVLGEEGTGMCATVAGRDERLYRIRSWRMTETDRITIHLDHLSGGELSEVGPLRTLSGKRRRHRLDLVAAGKHSMTLWREADLLRNNSRLRSRMEP